MLFWIITTGEQLPEIDGKNVRLWRSVLLSEALIKKGHHVVRWSSTFDHSTKKHRFENNHTIQVSDNYKLKFIKSPGYVKNVSLKRLIDHIVVARKFSKLALNEPKPDIILCSLPTIELCLEATKYGKKYNVPVVLDGRDMWPDIFKEAFPSKLKALANILLAPMYYGVKKACKRASYLTGISEPYIEWELNYAQRPRKLYDKSFPHAYSTQLPSEQEIAQGFEFWEKQGVKKVDYNICLFTAMGNVLDIDTIISAAKILQKTVPNIKFVLCGSGVRLEEFKQKALGINNIIFPGWVNYPQIWTLMRISKLGILPYWDIENYKNNIPNKPIEYLSAGLPILSSVSGLVKDMIEKYQCGFYYENSNPQRLADILISLYSNNDLLKLYSENSERLFKQNYTSEKVYNSMADYLIEIANDYKNEGLHKRN